MPSTETKTLTFRGLDGYAGFIHGMKYEVEVTSVDDGSGDKLVSMPHAPQHGPARFDAAQWAAWWLGQVQ